MVFTRDKRQPTLTGFLVVNININNIFAGKLGVILLKYRQIHRLLAAFLRFQKGWVKVEVTGPGMAGGQASAGDCAVQPEGKWLHG